MLGDKANFLAQLSAKKGWGFTRFDYLGHGQSDGDAEFCSLHDWLDDTLAVLDSIPNKVTLIGSSMGAWLAVHAMLQRPDKIQSLVTIAAAPDFTEKLLWPALSEGQQLTIEQDECVSIATHYDGEDWRIRSRLFESGRKLALLNDTAPLPISVPIRLIHGTADTDVPWHFSQLLSERFAHSSDAELTLVTGGDHRLSNQMGLHQLEQALHQLIDLNAL